MMSTPKPLHDTSADRSTKVMGLVLRTKETLNRVKQKVSSLKLKYYRDWKLERRRSNEFPTTLLTSTTGEFGDREMRIDFNLGHAA